MRKVEHLARPLVRSLAASVLAITLTASVSSVSAAGTGFETIYSLTGEGVGKRGTGSVPYGSLVQGPDGMLHGTAFAGGRSDKGALFRITTEGRSGRMDYSFWPSGDAGHGPLAGLTLAHDNSFYGTTIEGKHNAGAVFRLDADKQLTVIHAFTGKSDGANPTTALLLAGDGSLYGTTSLAPKFKCCGTAYRLTPDGVFQTLHVFNADEGSMPSALIEGPEGDFYGTTGQAGANGGGTIFRMSQSGTVTVLHAFSLNSDDGYQPSAALLLAGDGNFYGTTRFGGQDGMGTVFRMSPAGEFTLLHSFRGAPTEGSSPQAALIQASNGKLYGTTVAGGSEDTGTLFAVSTEGDVKTVFDFSQALGRAPYAALLEARNGLLYGTTLGGGGGGSGTVFRIKAK